MAGLVRPLPKIYDKFSGGFVRCPNDNCPRQWCTFAHSELELEVWNARKQDILDCKLL